MHPEQKKIYRNMRPEEKLKVAMDLYCSAGALKAIQCAASIIEFCRHQIG